MRHMVLKWCSAKIEHFVVAWTTGLKAILLQLHILHYKCKLDRQDFFWAIPIFCLPIADNGNSSQLKKDTEVFMFLQNNSGDKHKRNLQILLACRAMYNCIFPSSRENFELHKIPIPMYLTANHMHSLRSLCAAGFLLTRYFRASTLLKFSFYIKGLMHAFPNARVIYVS